MLNPTEIEYCANLIIGRLLDVAWNQPESVLNGICATQIDAEALLDQTEEDRRLMDIAGNIEEILDKVAAELGIGPELLDWDHNGGFGRDRTYIFNAPADCFKAPAAADREQQLRDALAALCKAAKHVEDEPYIFVLRRSDIEAAMAAVVRSSNAAVLRNLKGEV